METQTMNAKGKPTTPLRLQGGFGSNRNIVPVVRGVAVVGEMHMHRRSGWRGGPSYQFHPNAEGEARGLNAKTGASVRAILRELAELTGEAHVE